MKRMLIDTNIYSEFKRGNEEVVAKRACISLPRFSCRTLLYRMGRIPRACRGDA